MIRGQDETPGRGERERVVRLATTGGRGRAHVALGGFALEGEAFCSPTDAGQGPQPARRPRNLDRDQRATILAGTCDAD